MNVHKNAPLTPKGREAMVRSVVDGVLSKADAADQFNTTPKTVAFSGQMLGCDTHQTVPLGIVRRHYAAGRPSAWAGGCLVIFSD